MFADIPVFPASNVDAYQSLRDMLFASSQCTAGFVQDSTDIANSVVVYFDILQAAEVLDFSANFVHRLKMQVSETNKSTNIFYSISFYLIMVMEPVIGGLPFFGLII